MTTKIVVTILFAVLVSTTHGTEKCCQDLGCYSDGGDFHHILYRPINSLPDCDYISFFKLRLNTRSNPETTTIIDPYTPPTILQSGFQLDKDTKIIVHGFTDNWAWSWWADFKTAFLEEADVNVIRVDWAGANSPPMVQAAANARLLGSYVAKFIKQAQEIHGYDPARIHLIGHSLGAQCVGYIGAEVQNPKVGRITGIDPAGMYFANMPTAVRLDPTDATLVDTIITDQGSLLAMAFGSRQAMGHLNFFANGGSAQPGCDQSLFSTIFGGPSSFNTSSFDTAAIVTQTGYQAVMCNHYRAVALFTETIRSSRCPLTFYRCSSYDEFLQGKCFSCQNGGCSKLGLHLEENLVDQNQQISFYGLTTDRPSYCTNTYRLKFKLQAKSITNFNEAREERGYVYVILQGSQGISSKFLLTPEEIDLEPGKEYGFLFNTPQNLGTIISVQFEWDARFNILIPSEWLRRHYLYIDGDLQITTDKEVSSRFRLPSNKIEEEKLVRANLVGRKLF